MSAATLVQETLPIEVLDPCHIVVLSEDGSTHQAALEICSRLLSRFEEELLFAAQNWRFDQLHDPESAREAADSAARADVLILTINGSDTSLVLSDWLETVAALRMKPEGVLGVIIQAPVPSPPVIARMLDRFRSVAFQLRMTFLPLVRPIAGDRGGHTGFPLMIPESELRETSNTHWGLNE
ncbi:MAG TPA: hypothetical protein VK327_08875 [Candidatus Paceibacterota bacterium]|nr:hypothetical protein [Candidatus Paceibacterota bacterium]